MHWVSLLLLLASSTLLDVTPSELGDPPALHGSWHSYCDLSLVLCTMHHPVALWLLPCSISHVFTEHTAIASCRIFISLFFTFFHLLFLSLPISFLPSYFLLLLVSFRTEPRINTSRPIPFLSPNKKRTILSVP